MNSSDWNDQKIETIIGSLLRVGVMLAAAVVLFGAVVYLSRHGGTTVDYKTFHGEPEQLRSVTEISSGAVQMSGRAIIQLGLLLLIATPIARVIFSAAAFALERDYLYVFLTLCVLAVLLFSLIGSQ